MCLCVYGRFLTIIIINAMPTMRMMIMAATAGKKYVSTVDDGTCVGEVVAVGAPAIIKLDSADDDQYAPDPSNEAMTVYLPSIGIRSDGNSKLKLPLASVTTEV